MPTLFAICEDANFNDTAFKTEPLGQHCNEGPCVQAIKQHLKNAVDGDKAGNVVRVAIRQFIPNQHHRDAAGYADQDQPTHIGGLAPEENYGQEEHQHRANKPVLHERQPENPLVAEYFSQLFVSHLRKRRKHHNDEADSYRYVCCLSLKVVDKAG